MGYRSLARCVADLAQTGQLVVIDEEVDPKKAKQTAQKPATEPTKPVRSSHLPAPAPKSATARAKAGITAKAPLTSQHIERKAKPRIPRSKAMGLPRLKSGGRKIAGAVATLKSAGSVAAVRKNLGLTQELFARLIGVTQRSITAWENGGEINDVSLRRVREMDHLAEELRKSMREDFIPHWLVSPNEGLGGISPIEAMERGEAARVWRSVFLMGSGIPV
jgi:DNA-binding transcriptional regulator YiaG